MLIAKLAAATTWLLPLAQASSEAEGRGYSISWAIIMLSVILGLVVALQPAKRSAEMRKTNDDE